MTQPYSVAFVFARGGSKGVPKKNIRLLAGKPLIAYSIEAARQCAGVDRVVVSTDSPEIADIALAWGAEVPFLRPPELATDTASEWLAWRHAIAEVERVSGRRIDAFLSVPTTSPLRDVDDLDACLGKLLVSDADIVLTVTPSQRSPYFNMVSFDATGAVGLLMPLPKGVLRRQEAPRSYDITTVAYAARRDFVLRADAMFQGRVAAVVVPPERALDIDTEFDFQVAELLLRNKASMPSAATRRAA